jgi:hypothetical protein
MNSKKRKENTGMYLPIALASSSASRLAVFSAPPSAGEATAEPPVIDNANDTHITVKELIDILKSFPDNFPILISGYKTGYDCFYLPEVCKLIHKPENMHWDGEYQIPETGETPDLSAVILVRVQRDD